MLIRDATAADWPGIWAFMSRIVAAGDTFCWDTDTTSEQAQARWLHEPPGATLVAVDADGTILGTGEMHRNQGGGGAHVANAGFRHPTQGYVGLHIMYRKLSSNTPVTCAAPNFPKSQGRRAYRSSVDRKDDVGSMNARPASGSRSPDPFPALRVAALIAAILGVLVLAAAAFILSYPGIHQLARTAGMPVTLARVFPVIFDALLVVAIAAVLSLHGAGWWRRGYSWLITLLLLAAMAAGGVLHAVHPHIPHRPAAITAAVLPWALLLIAFSLLLSMLRQFRPTRLNPAGEPAAGQPAVPPAPARPRTGLDSLLTSGTTRIVPAQPSSTPAPAAPTPASQAPVPAAPAQAATHTSTVPIAGPVPPRPTPPPDQITPTGTGWADRTGTDTAAASNGTAASTSAATSPAGPAPAGAGPADTAPVGNAPAGTSAADPGAREANGSGVKPADAEQADTTPADTRPADTTPADTGPGDTKPAGTTPADSGPADSPPSGTGPASARDRTHAGSVRAEPAAAQPGDETPDGDETPPDEAGAESAPSPDADRAAGAGEPPASPGAGTIHVPPQPMRAPVPAPSPHFDRLRSMPTPPEDDTDSDA